MKWLFLIKALITWPVFLWSWIRLRKKAKTKTKGKNFDEEHFYRWSKRYARYFLWLEGIKVKVINKVIWNEKANFILINNDDPLILLALMKTNKFEENAPLSFLMNESFWNKLTTKWKRFYSLINYYIWSKKHQEEKKEKMIKQCIQNIQIPRNLVLAFDPSIEEWKHIVKIPYGGLTQTLFAKTEKNKNEIKITFHEVISPVNLLKLNKSFYIKKVKKWNSPT